MAQSLIHLLQSSIGKLPVLVCCLAALTYLVKIDRSLADISVEVSSSIVVASTNEVEREQIQLSSHLSLHKKSAEEYGASCGSLHSRSQGRKNNVGSCGIKPIECTRKNFSQKPIARRRFKDIDYIPWLKQEVYLAAKAGGVDPALMLAIMDEESGFHPMSLRGTVSGIKSDHGVIQMQVRTARATGKYLKRVRGTMSKHPVIPSSLHFTNTSLHFGLTAIPLNCSVASLSWKYKFTAECFESIKKYCGNDRDGLVSSLYCPQYAVRLLAFHLKRTFEEDITRTIKARKIRLSYLLRGASQKSAAAARFVVSKYNRGERVYVSLQHMLAKDKDIKPGVAEHYDRLLAVKRPAEFIAKDEGGLGVAQDFFAGGSLKNHRINKCYVWRITGLCGGLKGSLMERYATEICKDQRKGIYHKDKSDVIGPTAQIFK